MLTGASEQGLSLMEKYIENTSDVQTVCLILLHSLPNSICFDSKAQYWLENYRNLLNFWRLWDERGTFDIKWYTTIRNSRLLGLRSSNSGSANPSHDQVVQGSLATAMHHSAPSLFIACSFCDTNIAQPFRSAVPRRPMYQSHLKKPQHSRVQSCPGCRKALPRCAVCLAQMGTLASFHPPQADKAITGSRPKINPISLWFSWCQRCKHGGHALHLMEWFREHPICPVTSCPCKCITLDHLP